jgi:hypothetical protein
VYTAVPGDNLASDSSYGLFSGIGPLSCFQTIFTGNISNLSGVTAPAPTTVAGTLNLGPVGLGYLALGNYIGDCSVFYCPTASTSMPAPGCLSSTVNAADGWDSGLAFWDPPRLAAKNISDLKTSTYGGMDALDIMRGNYNWITGISGVKGYDGNCVASSPPGAVQNAVLSQYAYRDVPFSAWPWDSPSNPAACAIMRVDYVSPALTFTLADWMGPLFKTQKILGGRALVADAFSKNSTEPSSFAGPGYYGHRDGYNVLYGDWSAHWWGDPLQKFIWWQTTPCGGVSSYYSGCGGDTNIVTDYMTGGTIAASMTGNGTTLGIGANGSTETGNGSVIQWHTLDLANGIDNLANP